MTRPLGRIEFGGPDLPARRLRDLLQRHVDEAPRGSRIDWATYYFRDRELARALMRASDRGVEVRLALEPHPRREGANGLVIEMLSSHGLGGGLHLFRPEGRRGHLHAKVYAFSEPDIAWVGSFNPSGDEPENAEIISEIGDQDRGHNLLLGITRPKLTAALRKFVRRASRPRRLPFPLRVDRHLPVVDGDSRLYFYPRILTDVVEREIRALRAGDRMRAAVSHMKPGPFTEAIAGATARGADVELLVHDTERRVPSEIVEELSASGASIRRIDHPEQLPMHAKFVLIRNGGRSAAWLGSYNFNKSSRRRNSEVLLRTEDSAVIESLEQRFGRIAAMRWDASVPQRVANPSRIP